MSKFFNNLGELTSKPTLEVAEKLNVWVSVLMNELLADGMTILEGRVITDYLKNQVDISALMVLMDEQAKLHEENVAKGEQP